MKKENTRRGFIQKVMAMSSLSLFSSNTLFSMNRADTNSIITKRPLGFQWQTQDPFLFCVHHEDFYPRGNSNLGPAASLDGRHLGQDFVVKDGWRMYHGTKVPGFPGHPHRGFETITVVRKGMVDHSDSMGASGRYGDGDVQWMTAGKGVQHSEMFPLLNEESDNPLELFQIWLNLPKASKMVEPHFKMFWNNEIPKRAFGSDSDNKVHIEVLAGELREDKAPVAPPDSWAAKKENEVMILNIRMEANSAWTLPAASSGLNRSLYFYSGNGLSLNNEQLDHYHAADVLSEHEIVLKAGDQDCHILVLQGKPINEPVVQHGPFVMNSKEEIQQTFADYQQTKFGGWPWPSFDHTHNREEGRFAKHADGTIVRPS